MTVRDIHLIDSICRDIKACLLKIMLQRKLEVFINESETLMQSYEKLRIFIAWLGIESYSIVPFGTEDYLWFKVRVTVRYPMMEFSITKIIKPSTDV